MVPIVQPRSADIKAKSNEFPPGLQGVFGHEGGFVKSLSVKKLAQNAHWHAAVSSKKLARESLACQEATLLFSHSPHAALALPVAEVSLRIVMRYQK